MAQSAGFVTGNTGTRFRLVSQGLQHPPRGTVIWVHAFAEEMNKTRRMSARMARLLAMDGWRVVQKDLAGCGDSSGEFRDASWPDWIDDLKRELTLAPVQQPAWLWCVRAGALLVPPLVEERPDVNLMLWQPVISGAQHLQQFLRLHAGARIAGSTANALQIPPEQMLRAGNMVEVGGYELNAGLAGAMAAATFKLPESHSGRLLWMDVATDPTGAPSPAARRGAERLRSSGSNVELETVRGPAFWQTQEIEDCDALLERTRVVMCDTTETHNIGVPGATR